MLVPSSLLMENFFVIHLFFTGSMLRSRTLKILNHGKPCTKRNGLCMENRYILQNERYLNPDNFGIPISQFRNCNYEKRCSIPESDSLIERLNFNVTEYMNLKQENVLFIFKPACHNNDIWRKINPHVSWTEFINEKCHMITFSITKQSFVS